MNGEQLVFLIARFDLLLIAVILLLGDALLWLPPSRGRLPRRQLLFGRVFLLFLGLLFSWFAVAVDVDSTDLSPLTLGRTYVIVLATPLIVVITVLTILSLFIAIQHVLGHDVERYRPLTEMMRKWGWRLTDVQRPGPGVSGRDRMIEQKLAQKLAARQSRRKSATPGATTRPSRVGPARSRW